MQYIRNLLSVWLGLSLSCVAFAADHTTDSLEKVKELLASKKAILVDVREKSEWDAGHIAGAKFVPLSKLKERITEQQLKEFFPEDKIIYLYCAGGYRCLDVAEMFEDQKKLQLKALKHGYINLIKAGFSKAEAEKQDTKATPK
jgi:rhodanese-related sulfurtransferase